MELIKNKPLHSEITVMFSTQEEVGERGAKIGAFDIEPYPDISDRIKSLTLFSSPDAPFSIQSFSSNSTVMPTPP